MARRNIQALVIDDDRAQQRLIQRRLDSADAAVTATVVNNLDAFVAELQRGRWDAVVLDYHLCNVTAVDVLRRHAASLADAAVLVISASADQAIVIEALREGAIDFVPKEQATEPGVLATAIRNAVSRIRGQRLERRSMERRCRQLHREAETDALTGLSNRAHYDRCVREGRWRGDRRHQVCAMIDIDHFKQVNDTHGHAAGDQALQDVARLLRRSVPDGSTVVRLGGEEFAVVIAERDESAAFAWAEAFRERVSRYVIQHENNAFSVTVSLGLTRPNLVEEQQPPLALADELLYTAKDMGRNTVATPQIARLNRAVAKVRSDPTLKTVLQRRRRLLELLQSPRRPIQFEHIGRHGDQVAVVAAGLACRLGLPGTAVSAIRTAAALHDIGKAIIPETVLAHPGRLSSAQWVLMNRQAWFGAWVAQQLGAKPLVSWLVANHRTRFDEERDLNSPPQGRSRITRDVALLAAGILGVADSVATMRAERSHSPAKPEPQIRGELGRLSGQQFHPEAVQTFMRLSNTRHSIRLAA